MVLFLPLVRFEPHTYLFKGSVFATNSDGFVKVFCYKFAYFPECPVFTGLEESYKGFDGFVT
jgi:hypothetical protein